MSTPKGKSTAEIYIIRNYNFIGSGLRAYPTVNGQKIAGLYTKNYVRFYLMEGTYSFGSMYPDNFLGRWKKGNSINRKVEANKRYYFLLSPDVLWAMEIEEIDMKEAEKRIATSTLIQTGKLSVRPDSLTRSVLPLEKAIGLKEVKKGPGTGN